jgi:hypothetical protein
MVDESAEQGVEMTQPIIIDLGKQKSKKIKDLKNGEGPVWEDVFAIVEEVKAELGPQADNKIILPVIMIYEKRPKRKSLNKLFFPYLK